MHNLKGRQSAQLDTFSGLVTLASPSDLPEGASPRCQNVDFQAGSVFTRQGLTNPFTYQDAAVGPSPGQSATDVAQPFGVPWSQPANVLVNTGAFASATLNNISLNVTNVQVLVDNPPSPQPTTYGLLVTFSENVPVFSPGETYSFSGLTGYTALNGQTLRPTQTFPYMPASNQQIFLFGNAGYGPAADTGAAATSDAAPTDAIAITEFGFNAPSTATPQGFEISVLSYGTAPGVTGSLSTPPVLSVQMLKAGVPVGGVRSIAMPLNAPAAITLGGINDLFGETWVFSDLNNTAFGVRLSVTCTEAAKIFVGYTTLRAYFAPTQENFNYVATFEDNFGTIRTVALDANGQFWVENVSTNPGVLAPLFNGPPAGSFCTSFTADSRQYMAISDLLQGNYPPQQYTGQWTDRVSQFGPGAAPTFTPSTATATTYAITSITQPVGQSRGFSYFLQSTGPGSTSPGNVATVYYSDSTGAGPDTDLVNAFNSGNPVYLYFSFTGAPTTIGPVVVQVTSVGLGSPPSQPRQFYYFTYTVLTGNVNQFLLYAGSGHGGYTANYQRSLATLTTSAPVPGLSVNNQMTISGSSVPAYDNQWTISQALNSGSFEITQTSISGGLAVFNYILVSGSPATAGQLITISGTDNANGQLNMVGATIASVAAGTFTIAVSLPDTPAASEQGQATTEGTIFAFDPGAVDLGSSTDPIFGDATGGSLTFGGASGQFIAAGTRQGSVFFITRNGYYTRPAPPVIFTAPAETTAILATNIPIGPPNVVARAIVLTEAGANGVPGANFYTLPQPVKYVVENVTYTADSLFLNDNTSTTATFSFTDAVLLNAEQIDIQGNDLFNLGELGDSAWNTQYAGRTVWGRVRNKVQNFLNLTFDGGYLANPGGNLLPLGWSLVNSTVPAGSGPTLLDSPVFGNSFYASNTSGSTQAQFCMLYQSAYQDNNNVAILQNQTPYSVRVTIRTPASAAGGALVIDLAAYDVGTGFGQVFGTYVLPLASMSSTMATYEGALLTDSTLNIPADLVLRVWGQNIAAGADYEIDRIEIFPSEAPTNLTQLTMSYQGDPESFDQVTGGIDTTTVNAQPVNGAFTMHDLLYVVKESSLGYVADSPNQEPANWNPFREVSNVAGACGVHAYDVGEEWAVMACRNGLFLFNGGAPTPVQLEIPDIWNAINWTYGHTICVRNDVSSRKIYCAIPLPTPNPWMVTEEVNANPQTPNVMLVLNYDGIGSIEELMNAPSMQVTISGKLAVRDLRRKWSLWTIPTPYMGLVKRNELDSLMMFCNGIASSKIYFLGAVTGQDDGASFTSSYCTYGFVNEQKAQENPMFGLHNKRFCYFDLLASGEGKAMLEFFQNTLRAPYPFIVPGGVALSNPAFNDVEGPLDEFAQRMFAEIAITQGWFRWNRLTLVGAADRWSPLRGF